MAIATVLYQAKGGNEVWLVDLERNGAPSKQTFNDASDRFAIWSPDDDQLVFTSSRGQQEDSYLKRTTATAEELISTHAPGAPVPTSWSAKGFLLYTAVWKGPEELWVHPMSAGGKPFQILATPAADRVQGQFAPDGRFVAYVSNESGPYDVYVAPFDAQATGVRVSTAGGDLPRWNSDGTELFYVQPGRDAASNPTLMAATLVREAGHVRVVKVTELFSVRPAIPVGPDQSYFYDVADDTERFLVNRGPDLESSPAPITVVVDWLAGKPQ